MKIVLISLFFIFFFGTVVSANIAKYVEVSVLQQSFVAIVGDQVSVDTDYKKKVFQDAFLEFIKIGINEDQYFLYVDRNPKKQMIFVYFYDSELRRIIEIGRDKVSTGNPKRKNFYITPEGVFKNSTENFSYRALGTKNSKGWRGLGKKGSRVWDFGWQKTTEIKKGIEKERLIRLVMHATDPDHGELLLGQPTSQGCVRISSKLNKFLDYFGIIDKEYSMSEDNPKIKWLFKENRQPVLYPGSLLIVGDSRN